MLKHTWRKGIAVTTVLVLLAGAACSSDDDAGEATMPLAAWVTAFNRICEHAIAETDAEMTDEEVEATLERALAEARALPEPDEMADTTAEFLDLLLGSDLDADLTQVEIDSIEELLFAAFAALGISETCERGAPG
jgi:hypothetical protein